jgi:hypothetical protein
MLIIKKHNKKPLQCQTKKRRKKNGSIKCVTWKNKV